MKPRKLSVKLFAAPDPTRPVELHGFIALFHRFIQQKAVEGLLIDVADYIHVPEGPGVMLIGHDVDYGIDLAGGRAGLLAVAKRNGELPVADLLRQTLRRALGAARAIEADGSQPVRFASGELEIQVLDRLAAPNEDAAWEALRGALEPSLTELYGKIRIARWGGGDGRKALGLSVSADGAPDYDTLLAQLGGAPQGGDVEQQSPWDISVEELKRLRDSGADFVLLDVREPNEVEICELGGQLIPLGELPGRMDELDRSAHLVVHCRSGGRSSKAVELLRGAGFGNAWNVNGGILAWIDRIDPSLTRY